MKYAEIRPGALRRPYIKCYFIMESETGGDFSDTIFPGGHIEIVFNLGETLWHSTIGNKQQTDPPIELLGQMTRPMFIKTKGKFMMLGIRFFAHTPAYFFRDQVSIFNNQISDVRDVLGDPVKTLHTRLVEVQGVAQRIALIEDFLTGMLSS